MKLEPRFPGRTAPVLRLHTSLWCVTPERALAPLYPSVTYRPVTSGRCVTCGGPLDLDDICLRCDEEDVIR